MVKGISRQVIVVESPEPKLFEQAIFILRDGQKEVTDDVLLKEAKRLMGTRPGGYNQPRIFSRVLYAIGGASLTGIIWALCALI